MSAQRIYQDLVSEHQFKGNYDSVKRFVRNFAQSHSVPFRRMESEPGQEAQIDFGQGAFFYLLGRGPVLAAEQSSAQPRGQWSTRYTEPYLVGGLRVRGPTWLKSM